MFNSEMVSVDLMIYRFDKGHTIFLDIDGRISISAIYIIQYTFQARWNSGEVPQLNLIDSTLSVRHSHSLDQQDSQN